MNHGTREPVRHYWPLGSRDIACGRKAALGTFTRDPLRVTCRHCAQLESFQRDKRTAISGKESAR